MAHSRRRRGLAMVMASALLIGVAVAATSGSWAARQDDGETPHPAHVHDGTCDDLGDIVHPLNDVAPISGGEVLGNGGEDPVEASETEIDAPLGALLNDPFAINLHRSAEAIQDYIACGEIGGRVVAGQLVIGLHATNDSGFTGVALIEDNGPTTNVTVYLVEAATADEGINSPPTRAPASPAPASETATPDEATAAPDEGTVPPEEEATAPAEAEATAAPAVEATAAAEEVAIAIVDFAFEQATVEVPVGSTVTWTNEGDAPHTVTSVNGEFDSGTLQPGETFTATFTEPATFAYLCAIHPEMTATITITGDDADPAEPAEDSAEDETDDVAPAGEEGTAVEIRNFTFTPDPVAIDVGDTITWTNQDGVRHTATGSDPDLLQSGPLVAGESFSQTFAEAGTFEYHCDFHADMTGTISVE